MSDVRDGLFYTKDHEWVKIDGDTATVGISDEAQHLLTDIVFVELADTGKAVEQFKPACVVESVKSVSDVYSPLAGTISEVNEELEGSPELVNNEPYDGGWMFKLSDFDESGVENLMTADQYKEFLANEAH